MTEELNIFYNGIGYFCGRMENLRMLAELLDIVAAEVFSEQLVLTNVERVILFSLPKVEFFALLC
jgi:hypothetical protein